MRTKKNVGLDQEPELHIVGMRIRERRKALGMTQRELAKRARLRSKSAVDHVEAGRGLPSMVTLVRMCRALNVSADHVLGLKLQPR